MRGRGVTSHARTIAVLAVALLVLVLAPTVVRALQSLDCGPSSTGLTFSRSSPAPPLRIQLVPPEDFFLGTSGSEESGVADVRGHALLTDDVAPLSLCTASPDITRGPPSSQLS